MELYVYSNVIQDRIQLKLANTIFESDSTFDPSLPSCVRL